MNQSEPNLIHSGLSGTVTKDDVTVRVYIVRLDNEPGWSLEVVNSSATSFVWDDLFSSDLASTAYRHYIDGATGYPAPCCR
jgi:hypothetical protein